MPFYQVLRRQNGEVAVAWEGAARNKQEALAAAVAALGLRWTSNLSVVEPMRACLDIPGDAEGGRVVIVGDWLEANVADGALRGAALLAIAHGRPYRAPNGAWSLTPID